MPSSHGWPLKAHQAEQSNAQLAYEAAQEKRQAAEIALNAMSKEAAGIESRVEVLRQLQEQGEGFDEGTQAVLRGLDNPTFSNPPFTAHWRTKSRSSLAYIPAVEATLAARLQAIIFKDSGVAELALQDLSRRRLGKATP